MRYATSILLILGLLLLTTISGHPALAQDPANTLPTNPFQRKLPAAARGGMTEEQQNALNRATPEQRQKAQQIFQEMLNKSLRKAARTSGRDEVNATQLMIPLMDKEGKQQMRPATISEKLLNQPAVFKPQTSALKLKSSHAFESDRVSLNHARPATKGMVAAPAAMQAGCYKSIEQFIRDTFQAILLRQPYGGEFVNWTNLLNQAQAQGVTELVIQARDVGRTLFHTQEYYNRNRGDRDYVYDLYKGFLHREPDQGGWDAWFNLVPSIGRDAVLEGFTFSPEFYNHSSTLCSAATYDADADGLPNDFENRVADFFTPFYKVSTGEPNNFATFADTPDLTVSQIFNPYFPPSPTSSFRVTPYNIGYLNNQLVGVLRVDYLTFWDRDSGLAGGGFCYAAPFGLEFILSGLYAHEKDYERSAVLIAAPTVNGTFNTDPNAYSLYYMYTAAHEFSPTEQVTYVDFSGSPAPATQGHVPLALTRSKHGTYPFNPDYLPLIPSWIINDVLWQIESYCNCYYDPYCYYDLNREIQCAILYSTAYSFFFDCVVERYGETAGRFAGLRSNVGELHAPINNSRYILSPQISRQFNTPFFRF